MTRLNFIPKKMPSFSWLRKILRGLVFSLGILALVMIIAGIALAWKTAHPFKKPDQAILFINFSEDISEGNASDHWQSLFGQTPMTMMNLRQSLEDAAKDDQIIGLVGIVDGVHLGTARLQEIRGMIQNFRAAGKFTIAFTDSFGELGSNLAAYYLATAFERIWLQPSGDVGLYGLEIQVPFVQKALAKIGVKAEFGQRAAYKNSPDMFFRDEFTAAHRESLQHIIDKWQTQIFSDIAAARNVTSDHLKNLMQDSPLPAARALDENLVDHLGYWDELAREIFKDSNFKKQTGPMPLHIADYQLLRKAPDEDAPQIAVIHGLGPVERFYGSGESPFDTLNSYTMLDTVDQILEDDQIRAVILRIDSPGGSYIAADTIWRAVHSLRAKKIPVIVSIGDIAASGGYFVAMAGDEIILSPGSLTGSIGVYAGKFFGETLWDDIGVNWQKVSNGNANAFGIADITRGFDQKEWQNLNNHLDRIYKDFTEKAATDRGMDYNQLEPLARGRVWTGEDAVANGLADALGGFDVAIARAKVLTNIPETQDVALIPFPHPQSEWEQLMQLVTQPRLLPVMMKNLFRETLIQSFSDMLRPRIQINLDQETTPNLLATPVQIAP